MLSGWLTDLRQEIHGGDDIRLILIVLSVLGVEIYPNLLSMCKPFNPAGRKRTQGRIDAQV
jgi:hypothetical protein